MSERPRRMKREGPSPVVEPDLPLAHDARWVFGYGSNMDLTDLARWTGEKGFGPLAPHDVKVGTLRDHVLVWDYFAWSRHGGAANCAPGDGHLPGVLIRVSEALLEALDHKEGVTYYRAVHEVHTSDGVVRAWVYRVLDAYREPQPVLPRRAYLDIVVRAARHHQLPDSHIAWLEGCPTLDD